jgi:hypothetical protein
MTTEGNIPFGIPPSEEVRREAAKPENNPLRGCQGIAGAVVLGGLCWIMIGVIGWLLLK